MLRHRTLIARLDNAGDVLLTGPAVRAVATTNDVVFLCGEQGSAAAALLPGVSRVETAHVPWIDANPRPVDDRNVRDLVGRIRSWNVDEAAILVSSHQSPLPLALLLRQAGVPRIAAVSHDYAGSLLDARIPGDPDLHEVERNLLVVGALGHRLAPGDDSSLAVRRPSATRPATPADAIVVHPGASVPARTWPVARWQQLAAALAARGHRLVVTGGPSERHLTAPVARAAGRHAIDLGGATDFAGLASVLRDATVVCSGNTGPMHLAAAVGTPVVALFPPTVPPRRWHPWGVRHELLGRHDIECAGCRSTSCPVPDQPCLGSVGLDDAVAAVERLGGSSRPGAAEEILATGALA